MNFVEKHSKLLAVALCLCASGPILSTVHAYEVQPGWHSNGEVSYYVLDNHKKAVGLMEIDGDTYYFASNGDMQTGWQNISNQTYYFDNNGKAVKGKTEIQGTTYNFQQTGSLSQGWADGDSYYNEKGFKVANSWINDEGYKFYLDENGNLVKNTWKEIDGARYYFDENGRVAVGEVNVDGSTYYTDDQGIFQTGWVNNGVSTVYYNENGSLNTDAFKEIDGNLYAFDADGSLLVNTEKDGYVISESGIATIKPEEVAPEITVPEASDPEVSVPDYTEPEASEPEYSEPEYTEPEASEPEYSEPEYTDTEESEPEYFEPEYTDTEESAPEVYEPEYVEPEYSEPEYVEPEVQEPVINTSVSDIIANAALSQVGVKQDCTMLVTNALAAAGIYHHGWPESYASLGPWTSNPVPGDIIIYSGHVAVYIGNGQAVHGGWNGVDTVIWSVNCANALIGYIHVG